MHLDSSKENVSIDEFKKWTPQPDEIALLKRYLETLTPSTTRPQLPTSRDYSDPIWQCFWVEAFCDAIIRRIHNAERLLVVTENTIYPKDAPYSLPRLVELNYSERLASHSDTLRGSLGNIAGILKAAPRLRVLRGFDLSSLMPLPLNMDNLNEVYLDLCILDYGSLEALRSFFLSYLLENPSQRLMSPFDIFRLLWLRRDTLSWLYLDYPQIADMPPPTRGDMITEFGGFRALETLIIDDKLLVPRSAAYPAGVHYVGYQLLFKPPHLGYKDTQSTLCQWENDVGRFKYPVDYPFSEFHLHERLLPSSLKKLVILSHHPNIVWDLVWLSNNASGLFPNLKCVHVEQRYLELPDGWRKGVLDIMITAERLWRNMPQRFAKKGILFSCIPPISRLLQWRDDPQVDGVL